MHQGSQRQQFFICSIIMIVWKVIMAVWIWNNHHDCVESLEKVCEKAKLETEMKNCKMLKIIMIVWKVIKAVWIWNKEK